MNVQKHRQAGMSRELTIYFNGVIEMDRKARAYAYAHGLAMKEFDVSRGELNINELLNAMRNSGLTVPELLNENKLKTRFGGGLIDFDYEDLIVMIKTDPCILKVPLAIKENQIILLNSASDILNY